MGGGDRGEVGSLYRDFGGQVQREHLLAPLSRFQYPGWFGGSRV